MELYRLRTFVTVAEVGHLTRAAERLHLSQPAVSGQIKALEQQFDLRLFERSASGMTLTVAGRALLARAHRVLAAADELTLAAKRLRGEIAGALRIGTVSDPASIRVGQLLAHAVERHPNLELQLQHETSGAVLERVRDARLDASFYFGNAPGPEFSSLRLRQFVYCITAPAAWRDQLRDADWSDIAALPWILTPANSTHNWLVTELLAEHGIDLPQRRVEADQESVLEDLVVSGVGVSLMREEAALARQRAGEVCIWDKASLRTTLWFVCAAERVDDPLLHAVFDILHEIWRDERAALLRGHAAHGAADSLVVAR